MNNEQRHLERLAAKKAGTWCFNWDNMNEEQRDIVRGSLQFQVWMLKLSLSILFKRIIHLLFPTRKQFRIVYYIAVAGLIAITVYALVIGYYINALFLSGFMLYLACLNT